MRLWMHYAIQYNMLHFFQLLILFILYKVRGWFDRLADASQKVVAPHELAADAALVDSWAQMPCPNLSLSCRSNWLGAGKDLRVQSQHGVSQMCTSSKGCLLYTSPSPRDA